mmetsp:Transcript_13038/g.23139  ORF Transcript_13038/g.23139 Transcript_13038/m.23139 type:complete len:220 (-) Transcript_13038:1167-1826(-)
MVTPILKAQNQNVLQRLCFGKHLACCLCIDQARNRNRYRGSWNEDAKVRRHTKPTLGDGKVLHFGDKTPGHRNLADVCENYRLFPALHVSKPFWKGYRASIDGNLRPVVVLERVKVAHNILKHLRATRHRPFTDANIKHSHDWFMVRGAHRGTTHVLQNSSVAVVYIPPEHSVAIRRRTLLFFRSPVIVVGTGLKFVCGKELYLSLLEPHKRPPCSLFK